jgi:hypothetical protein
VDDHSRGGLDQGVEELREGFGNQQEPLGSGDSWSIERPPRLHRVRRWLRILGRVVLGLFVLCVLLGVLLALAYTPATDARAHLLAAKDAMVRGQSEVASGDPLKAKQEFQAAEKSFAEATRAANGPALRLLGWIPFLGRTPDAVVALADGGRLVAQAGQQLSSAVADLPGGTAALAPKEGAVPIDRLRSLAPAVDRAQKLTHSGLARITRSSSSLLLGPVGEARQQALDQVGSLDRTLTTATILLRGLPGFLGQDGPKHYFFASANPAELRGTGGLFGAYSILTIDRGRFHFSRFVDVVGMPSFPPGTVQPPNPDYAHNYDFVGGANFLLNINMTPDFPSAAIAIERYMARATGDQLDGVMSADPQALAALLEVTGPVRFRGIAVDADNVVDYTTNRAYSQFGDATTRKLVLGEVAKVVFERFIQGIRSPASAIQRLGRAAAEGHILVYSNDKDFERGLVRIASGGALQGSVGIPHSDFLSVIQDNAVGTKADFYLRRAIEYRVQLTAGGAASTEVSTTLTNDAPTKGQPLEVIGPYPGTGFGPGENVAYLNVICARSCFLADTRSNGTPEGFSPLHELGLPLYRSFLRIPSGQSAEFSDSLQTAGAWEGSSTGGVYRLRLVNQTTIKPTTARIEVTAPPGMTIAYASVPLRVSGGKAIWEGILGRQLQIEVRFAPPLPQRLWKAFVKLLSKPLLRF